MIAAVVVLGIVALAALVLAGVVWAAGDDTGADNRLTVEAIWAEHAAREDARHAAHLALMDRTVAAMEAMRVQHAEQIDRLLETALSPDAGSSLRKLEVTAQQAIARAEVAARLNDERIERRYVEQEDERRFEHIGGIGT